MNPNADKVKILGGSAVTAKLRRMAYQIYEKNFAREEIVLCGIGQRGGFMADHIARMLTEISPLKVHILHAKKDDAARRIILPEEAAVVRDRVVVAVDDVLYSGYTLLSAVVAIMAHEPASIQTAVLIDRGHRSVPVTHDYVGMVLATTLKQYVAVEVDEDQEKAAAYVF